MQRKLARSWAQALESGEFPQTSGMLFDKDEGFCCLGVLSYLVQDDPKIVASGWELKQEYDSFAWEKGLDIHTGTLPKEVCQLMGITPDQAAVAVTMNDGKRWNFTQIAKWVRKEFKS